MDVSENSGFPPKSSILIGVFHYKPSILGYPCLWKHPSCRSIYQSIVPWAWKRGKLVIHHIPGTRRSSISPLKTMVYPNFHVTTGHLGGGRFNRPIFAKKCAKVKFPSVLKPARGWKNLVLYINETITP